MVDVLREGNVEVTCKPNNNDTDSLVWQGIDVSEQPIQVNSTTTYDGNSILSVPADVGYNQSTYTCSAYLTSSSQVPTVRIVRILFQGIYRIAENIGRL